MVVFAERFIRVLDALTADPAMAVGDVDILTDGDRAMLARLPAPVTATAHAQSSLAGIFADSAAAHPDSIAVTAGDVADLCRIGYPIPRGRVGTARSRCPGR